MSFVMLCKGRRERTAMVFWLARLVVRRLRRPTASAVRTLSIGGLLLTLDWAAAEHIPLREILIRGEYWPDSAYRPRRGDTVIDAGANAGIYSTVAARLVGPSGRVIAIEPNPVVLERLRQNIHQNGFDDRVRIVPTGLSDHGGSAMLLTGSNSTASTVIVDATTTTAGIEIALARLDDIVDPSSIRRIDLLKIDVEGSERATLAGGRRVLATVDRVVIEVSAAADVPSVVEACVAAGLGAVEEQASGADAGDSGARIVFSRRPARASAGRISGRGPMTGDGTALP